MQNELTLIEHEIAACDRGDHGNLRVSDLAARIVMRTARELGLTPASRKQAQRKPPEWWGDGEFFR
jgi:phage terminase small subunit